ncbi:hypothetical protein TL16_g07794 [Triparma laevis f. inornata]|uniref:Uncharacterized protein n=1 Tax=Triparma laevis f. inornata TaxID=1714386 RepID=A0A9W7AV26_9STRA|nr:hypothetical protein TL16_g07794 [Triparma laevis f. inornata]
MIKPIYDLYKIFMDYPTDHGCLVDPLQEFVDTKQVEVIYECVPQSIIQGLALFKTTLPNRRSQVISLVITVLSTGFNQAVSSIITDTDPRKRKKAKSSGYVGNSSFARTSAFSMLIVFTSIYNLLRISSYLLLINGLGKEAGLLIFAEYAMSIFGLYFVKGDFYCWWPVSGKFSVVLALMVRLQVFFVTNFAPYTEHRLPWDSGGLFWMMSIFWALCSNFLYVFLGFNANPNPDLAGSGSICSPFADECAEQITIGTAMAYLTGATFVALLFLFFFFLTIKRSHWKTFFENESSRQYNIRTGWNNEDDGQKCESLLKHESLMPPAEEVKAWMEQNWLEWEDENPSWFHHYRQTLLYVLSGEYLPSVEILAGGESIMKFRQIREEEEFLDEQRRLEEVSGRDGDGDGDDEDAEKNKTWAAGVRNGLRRASKAINIDGLSGSGAGTFGGRRTSHMGAGSGTGTFNDRRPSTFGGERSRKQSIQAGGGEKSGGKEERSKHIATLGMKLESHREQRRETDDSSGEKSMTEISQEEREHPTDLKPSNLHSHPNSPTKSQLKSHISPMYLLNLARLMTVLAVLGVALGLQIQPSSRRSFIRSAPLVPLAWGVASSSASARLEAVERPDLLPSTPNQKVIAAGIPILTAGQQKRATSIIDRIESKTGIRIRVLTQNYPVTPGLAIKEYWNLDKGNYVVMVIDDFGGKSNLLNFNVADDLDLTMPPIYFSRLAGKFGNLFYVKQSGKDQVIFDALESMEVCLVEEGFCKDPGTGQGGFK